MIHRLTYPNSFITIKRVDLDIKITNSELKIISKLETNTEWFRVNYVNES